MVVHKDLHQQIQQQLILKIIKMAIKSIVLNIGECLTLPDTSSVVSVTVDGDGQITSDCKNLPNISSYLCYKFTWERDTTGSLQDAVFSSLIIGDTIFLVPSNYNNYNSTLLANWIDEQPLTFSGLVKVGCHNICSNVYYLKLKVPSGLPAPQLKISNGGGGIINYSYLIGVLDTDCNNCNCP
jgi:hypothetical protein